MWQIMWAFSLIPDSAMTWIINILLLAGVLGLVAGFFVKFIPFVSRYRTPVRVISVIVLLLGVWLKGGESERRVWQERVKELEARVAKAEAASKTANAKMEKAVRESQKKIKENTRVIVKKVPEVITREANCVVPPPAVDLYNQAAKGEEIK
jgi:hypothetical protein